MTLFIIGFISSLREYKIKVKDELKDEKEVNNKKLSNKKIYQEKCGHKFSEKVCGAEHPNPIRTQIKTKRLKL